MVEVLSFFSEKLFQFFDLLNNIFIFDESFSVYKLLILICLFKVLFGFILGWSKHATSVRSHK